MTTYKRSRSRRKPSKQPVYPICGKRSNSYGTGWTPASIRRHEKGCIRCQEIGLTDKTNFKVIKRPNLVQFANELPFDDE